MVISVFYPESMLFTGEQLLRAGKLYKLIKENELDEGKAKYFPLTKDILSNYLKNLPPNVLEKERVTVKLETGN